MTLLRSLLIAILAALAAGIVRGLLADPRTRWRRLAWLLLPPPFLTPALLTGYAYANFSLSLVQHPVWNMAFYTVLIWMKLTPVAGLVLYFTPQNISATSLHCHQLLPASRWARLRFRLRAGEANSFVAAAALVFLFAFAEFEIASLLSVKTWTVTLFDAHAGGLALNESLRQVLLPFLIEALALAVAVALLFRRYVTPLPGISPRRVKRILGWIHLTLATGLVLVVPALVMLRGTIEGIRGALGNFALGREMAASLLFAAGATFCASLVAALWGGTKRRRSLTALVCLLGLLGPLVLALIILGVMQWPGLRACRDTPVPLILTLALVLLPAALVMRLALAATRTGSALHLAALMRPSRTAQELVWRFKTSGKFWTVFLLFSWAFWDLTASAILAPITMTPVTVRLYNLMHYGQTAALSTMLCAAFAAPLLIALLALGTRRWWARE